MKYTVKMQGKPLKFFDTQEEAKAWMVDFLLAQNLHKLALDFVDEAVLQSDMKEAKVVINHIMEMR